MLLVFRIMILVLAVYVVVYFLAIGYQQMFPIAPHEMAIDAAGQFINRFK